MRLAISALGAFGLVLVFDGLTMPTPARRRRALASLELLAAEAGFRLPAGAVAGACVASFITAFVAAAAVASSVVVAAIAAAAAAWTPIARLRAKRARRRRRLHESWPDALALLIASVRAGASLPQACVQLPDRVGDDLRPGWVAFASTYRASGSFSAGIARLRAQLQDPVADRVVVSLSLAHEVGGTELVRVLRALAEQVRDDLRTRKDIEARWSWTVTAARVAAAAPWIVLVLMATRSEAGAAYDSPTGAAVIAAGGAATFVGYRLMLRAGRLPEERRLS